MFARRTTVLGTAAVLVLAAGTLLGSAPVVAADESITIRGGQVRGAFNRTASAWSVYLTQNVAGLKASAEASAGSIDNTRTVNAGRAQLGLVFASDLYQGYRGEGSFKSAQTDVRALTFLFGSVGHFVVPASSDIKKLEDIQGKTISMGGPGSGSAKNLTALLKHIGLWGKFKAVYAGKKSPEALKNGKVAAFNWHPGLGNAMIRDTASSIKIRFIDMDAPARKSGFYKKYPYFGPTKIPASVYPNVDADTATFGTGTVMIANAGVSADTVHNILKAVYSDEGKAFLMKSAGKIVKQMTKANGLRSITVPMHPGAVRFWKEQGVSIPADLMPK